MDKLEEIKLNLALKENVIDNMHQAIDNNQGFKSNGRRYKRVFIRKERKSLAVDHYGGKYFAEEKQDYTKSISITLPRSMIKIIDSYCVDGVTRSRFIRKIIEYALDLEYFSTKFPEKNGT